VVPRRTAHESRRLRVEFARLRLEKRHRLLARPARRLGALLLGRVRRSDVTARVRVLVVVRYSVGRKDGSDGLVGSFERCWLGTMTGGGPGGEVVVPFWRLILGRGDG
jgi:hypothetical protein